MASLLQRMRLSRAGEAMVELLAIAPEGHGLVIGIRIVAEVQADRPAVFAPPALDERADRDGHSRADVDETVVALTKRKLHQDSRHFGHLQVVPELLAA